MKFDIHLSNIIISCPCGCGTIPVQQEKLREIEDPQLPMNLRERVFYVLDPEGNIVKSSFSKEENKNIFDVFSKEQYDFYQPLLKQVSQDRTFIDTFISEDHQKENLMISPMPTGPTNSSKPLQGFVIVRTPYMVDSSSPSDQLPSQSTKDPSQDPHQTDPT